jgi:hypothetical protein
MITRFILIASIFILTVMGLFAQPRIQVVGGTTFNFGDVYSGTKVTHNAMLKNAGTDTLFIKDVTAQCGCTAAMTSKKILAPSDTGSISITFNTGSYTNKVTKHVYVTSNDTTTPKLTIEFSANVINVLTVSPNYLTFNIQKNDSTYVKSITLTNTSKSSVKILSVNSKVNGLKATLMKNQLMPGDQTELQAVFRPTKRETMDGIIELTTDHPNQSRIEIKVFGLPR